VFAEVSDLFLTWNRRSQSATWYCVPFSFKQHSLSAHILRYWFPAYLFSICVGYANVKGFYQSCICHL